MGKPVRFNCWLGNSTPGLIGVIGVIGYWVTGEIGGRITVHERGGAPGQAGVGGYGGGSIQATTASNGSDVVRIEG